MCYQFEFLFFTRKNVSAIPNTKTLLWAPTSPPLINLANKQICVFTIINTFYLNSFIDIFFFGEMLPSWRGRDK